jgi:hypothetical protein
MRKSKKPKEVKVAEHESPARRLIAEAWGTPFDPLHSLNEARQHDDGVAILEGDWGGQIYVVVPAKMIHCLEHTLRQLLLQLDSAAWSCNENEGASIYYERQPTGSGITGGMGGGKSTGNLWVHSEFDAVADQIREVIEGKRESIDLKTD